MRYILSFIILALLTTLSAQKNYPELFAKQGTPLYKAVGSFTYRDNISGIKLFVDEYIIEAKRTKELGFKADKFNDSQNISIYFKSLRILQKKHDNIVGFSTKLLYESIKKDDYKEFKEIVNFGMDYYSKKPKMREKILSYYKKNRNISKIPSLEKILRYDRSVTKHYDETEYVFTQEIESETLSMADKKITLLSMNGCGWCDKVKDLLDSSGKNYREINVKNSEGSKLFKKYNGSGVPLLIVNDEVIRGYNPKKILKAIE